MTPASLLRRSAPTVVCTCPPFHPVPTRTRRDGWTIERQADFLGLLAETGSVIGACEAVALAQIPTCAHYPSDVAAGATVGAALNGALSLAWTGVKALARLAFR